MHNFTLLEDAMAKTVITVEDYIQTLREKAAREEWRAGDDWVVTEAREDVKAWDKTRGGDGSAGDGKKTVNYRDAAVAAITAELTGVMPATVPGPNEAAAPLPEVLLSHFSTFVEAANNAANGLSESIRFYLHDYRSEADNGADKRIAAIAIAADEQVTAVKTELDAVLVELDDRETSINRLNGELAATTARADNADGRAVELEKRIAALEKTVTEQALSLDEAARLQASGAAAVQSLNAQLTGKTTRISAQARELADMSATAAKVAGRVEQLEKDAAAATARAAELGAKLVEAAKTAGRVEQLEKEAAAATARAEQLEVKLVGAAKVAGRVEQLEKDAASATTAAEQLKKDVAAATVKAAELEKKLAAAAPAATGKRQGGDIK